MNLKARTLAAALALAALASPLSPRAAFAASHHRHHAHEDRASYPMKADEFRKLMEKRIDGVRAAIDKKLERRGVSPERKKAIHKIFDEASHDLRAEIDRAAASGTVSRGDAEKVKTLATGLRARVRERLRAEKDPKLKEKLTKGEAARKERAAHKKKAEAPSADHAPPASGAPKPPATHADPATKKTAAASPDARTKHAKAHASPTRTAKAPATAMRKHAKPETGADL